MIDDVSLAPVRVARLALELLLLLRAPLDATVLVSRDTVGVALRVVGWTVIVRKSRAAMKRAGIDPFRIMFTSQMATVTLSYGLSRASRACALGSGNRNVVQLDPLRGHRDPQIPVIQVIELLEPCRIP